MTLTFRTPSRRCPNRIFNETRVRIVEHVGHRRLRRSGVVPIFLVEWARTDPDAPYFTHVWEAYGDELFIEPRKEHE